MSKRQFLCVAALVVLDLCSSADQAGLQLRDLPASASRVLRLNVCTTTAWLEACFINELFKNRHRT